MKEFIQNWLNGRKTKAIKRRNAQLTSDYNIEEKGGYIYIVAGQHTIQKIEPTMTAEDIVIMLNEARQYQIDYYKK